MVWPAFSVGTWTSRLTPAVTEPEGAQTTANLIDELTYDRFVQFAQDGGDRWIEEWSRALE